MCLRHLLLYYCSTWYLLNTRWYKLMMIVLNSASVGEVYEEHRDEDGFLYVQYSGENTFGATDQLWSTFADCSALLVWLSDYPFTYMCIYV